MVVFKELSTDKKTARKGKMYITPSLKDKCYCQKFKEKSLDLNKLIIRSQICRFKCIYLSPLMI